MCCDAFHHVLMDVARTFRKSKRYPSVRDLLVDDRGKIILDASSSLLPILCAVAYQGHFEHVSRKLSVERLQEMFTWDGMTTCWITSTMW